jgi:adenine-specific DNA-methyltransferase
MPRKLEDAGNMFGTSPRDAFLEAAVQAQNKLAFIPNPYVGNKRKMLADIGMVIYDTIDFSKVNHVCDLFAGSSVVGAFFKMLGKEVSCNDLLISSYFNAQALLNGISAKITTEDWRFLTESKNKNKSNFIESQYSGTRFTSDEAKFIDNYYANCEVLYCESIDKAVAHTSLIHHIMAYCYVGGRLNSGQIIASLKHRLEHDRNQNREIPFRKMKRFSFDFPGKMSNCGHGDVSKFLERKPNQPYDLVYIDPPYGGQQSDYAFMYQFFEEYLNQKKFEDIDYLKDNSKKFVKAKTYKESFEELLKSLPRESIWVISYNDSSWANIDEISSIVKTFKPVTVKSIEYDYKYRAADNTSGTEYLIIG